MSSQTIKPFSVRPASNSDEKSGDGVEVRELAPEKYWVGSVKLPEGVTEDDLIEVLTDCAGKVGITYSGYLTKNEDGETVYSFSRYPRRAFGPVPPVETYQQALTILSEKLGTPGIENTPSGMPEFTVLLGLQEGYAEYKKTQVLGKISKGEIGTVEEAMVLIADLGVGDLLVGQEPLTLEQVEEKLRQLNLGKEHTPEEVRQILGEGSGLTEAQILAVGSWGNYTEPAVLIKGNLKELPAVYRLAQRFKQARIAVDNLLTGESHMVETVYCEDPDNS